MQRYWKWLFRFPNFGRFREVSGYSYCWLIISFQNVSKINNFWALSFKQHVGGCVKLHFPQSTFILKWGSSTLLKIMGSHWKEGKIRLDVNKVVYHYSYQKKIYEHRIFFSHPTISKQISVLKYHSLLRSVW